MLLCVANFQLFVLFFIKYDLPCPFPPTPPTPVCQLREKYFISEGKVTDKIKMLPDQLSCSLNCRRLNIGF